jgi:hypothetical protein
LGPGPTQFAEAASIAGKYYGFYSAGVAYDAGPLQAHLVISRQASQSLAFPPNDAAYASLAWRNGPLTPYVGWSAIRTRATTRSTGLPAGVAPPLDALIAGASQLQQGNANIQHTVSAGLRWDVAPKMAWKLQFDRVHAEAPLMWANRQPGWNGRASVVSVAMDFVF